MGIEPLMIGVGPASIAAIWKFVVDQISHRVKKLQIEVGVVEITVEGALSKDQQTGIVRNVTDSLSSKV